MEGPGLRRRDPCSGDLLDLHFQCPSGAPVGVHLVWALAGRTAGSGCRAGRSEVSSGAATTASGSIIALVPVMVVKVATTTSKRGECVRAHRQTSSASESEFFGKLTLREFDENSTRTLRGPVPSWKPLDELRIVPQSGGDLVVRADRPLERIDCAEAGADKRGDGDWDVIDGPDLGDLSRGGSRRRDQFDDY